MEASSSHFESLLFKAGEYAETKASILKLKVADKASDTVSDAASTVVVLLFVGLFTVMLSIGLALLIGEWMGKTWYGFLVIAGFYGIAGIVFHINRRNFVKTPVSNFIIGKFLKTPE
jgi:fatty acid desaturase